ncbi:MAG: hypothetical protein Q4A34_00910 [Candidatus Saccharibacteria bacterium]|nr:hypothetical protein [Candidatus Saccharibacteria bacterium]
MKKDKNHYEDVKNDLHDYLQILTRNINNAMGLVSERKGFFGRKTKNALLERDLRSAINYARMTTHALNDLIDLLEAYPEAVSDYLLEQERLKSLKPKVYRAMAKRGVIELDENGEPKGWRRGTVHVYWSELKKLMKKEYGIDWESPADKNPQIRYD